jgi:hypothetical protein
MLHENKYLLEPCLTESAMTEAFKLRYIAFRKIDAIAENPQKKFSDAYDSLENVRSCLVYEEQLPVASIRACMYDKESNFLKIPAFEVFRSDIEKEIGLDKKIIEATRLAIHPGKVDSKTLFKVPFRFIILSGLKAGAEYTIIAVKARYVSFYTRFFHMEVISDPKRYPGLNYETFLMAVEWSTMLPVLMEREEMFRFTEEELKTYPSFRSVEQLHICPVSPGQGFL